MILISFICFENCFLRNKSDINHRFPDFWFDKLLHRGDKRLWGRYLSQFLLLSPANTAYIYNSITSIELCFNTLPLSWVYQTPTLCWVAYIEIWSGNDFKKNPHSFLVWLTFWMKPRPPVVYSLTFGTLPSFLGFLPEDMEQGFAHSLPCNK